jgi:hypothetical protein
MEDWRDRLETEAGPVVWACKALHSLPGLRPSHNHLGLSLSCSPHLPRWQVPQASSPVFPL